MFELLQDQIASQITGKYKINIRFSDGTDELLILHAQGQKFWASTFPFFKHVAIPEPVFREIMELTDTKIDSQVRDSEAVVNMTYNDFFDKYVNRYRQVAAAV